MEVLIEYQLLTTLFSIILGVFIGLIYDMFKILRILSGLDFSKKVHNKILKLKLPLIKQIIAVKNNKFNHTMRSILYLIWDLLFFITIIPIVQIFVYATSSGIARWYIFAGGFLGFVLYYYTLSKLISPLYEYLLLTIRIIFAYGIYFIKLPLKKLFYIVKANLNKKIENRKIKQQSRDKKKKENERQILTSYGKNK